MSFKSGVKGRGSDRMVKAKVVTVMKWYVQNEVNQEESEQNEVGGKKKKADSTGEVMHKQHIWKSGWWYSYFIHTNDTT